MCVCVCIYIHSLRTTSNIHTYIHVYVCMYICIHVRYLWFWFLSCSFSIIYILFELDVLPREYQLIIINDWLLFPFYIWRLNYYLTSFFFFLFSVWQSNTHPSSKQRHHKILLNDWLLFFIFKGSKSINLAQTWNFPHCLQYARNIADVYIYIYIYI